MDDPIEQHAPDVATAMSVVTNARVALDIDMVDPGVALGSGAATVTDGVELFTTDSDGNLTVVGSQPR